MAKPNFTDLMHIVNKEEIKVPDDFWDFWHFYFDNPDKQVEIASNFGDFAEYSRLWNHLVMVSRKDK